ncbi:uncharacterized protein P174DRAFT_449390 [Aspergillus novofumigatus IBT 16806]|uniref:Helicase ATP-binding domain-containing protein n=1 Tax=Aspergillus novofumigatus (strain IBT 16806) TaxID=1392255 RepID=A0A2I1CJR3_ASPN1|nr:uncharacterized protein P174DRAFT_449390 [Aspergillus novofumigatus IBT 16806]PKX97859.1 hypothetical protein P174DRAFT_449390 [Aspergillus novofumigatus IBT 16806]
MQFRGVQDPAMRAIQRVRARGGGDAHAVGEEHAVHGARIRRPGGTTIIVVPLVALRADMTRRCQELGISRFEPAAVTRRLDRIVIDECHARTQMVWLTATLPPSMEGELCRWMKYDRAAVTIYRADQPAERGIPVCGAGHDRGGPGPYQWIESEAVVAFIQDRIQWAAGGKVIIYANIIGQVTAMARVLGCEAYYSEQLDKAGAGAVHGASP